MFEVVWKLLPSNSLTSTKQYREHSVIVYLYEVIFILKMPVNLPHLLIWKVIHTLRTTVLLQILFEAWKRISLYLLRHLEKKNSLFDKEFHQYQTEFVKTRSGFLVSLTLIDLPSQWKINAKQDWLCWHWSSLQIVAKDLIFLILCYRAVKDVSQ